MQLCDSLHDRYHFSSPRRVVDVVEICSFLSQPIFRTSRGVQNEMRALVETRKEDGEAK